MKTKNKLTVNISYEKLHDIAEYYEFPVAVFLTPDNFFKKEETRRKNLLRKAEAFDKIKEIVEELG